METKHIIHFTKWVDIIKLYESQVGDAYRDQWPTQYLDKSIFDALSQDFTFADLKNVLDQMNLKVTEKITNPDNKLSTRDICDWLNAMSILYELGKEQGKLTGLIFNYTAPILTKNFVAIQGFFSSSNKELTKLDMQSAKGYRELSGTEAKYITKVEDKLKELGLL